MYGLISDGAYNQNKKKPFRNKLNMLIEIGFPFTADLKRQFTVGNCTLSLVLINTFTLIVLIFDISTQRQENPGENSGKKKMMKYRLNRYSFRMGDGSSRFQAPTPITQKEPCPPLRCWPF